MASLRYLAVLVWVFILGFVGSSVMTLDSCFQLFQSDKGTLNGIDDVVTLSIDIDEDTPEETTIYTLTWESDCVEPPVIDDTSFTQYFTVNASSKCTWIVSVNTNLAGLPDFNPNPQEEIRTKVNFEGITVISPIQRCEVSLVHNIQDKNTQPPEPEKTEDNMKIIEGLPISYSINNFVTRVHDKDGTSPNNNFEVIITDKSCPIEATKSNYSSGENEASVFYQLRESLDYESVKKIICEVKIQDLGNPPLSTQTRIIINVVDAPDEPPIFEEDYYYSEVTYNMPPDKPLIIMPSMISASDGDADINKKITYSMHDVVMEVSGMEYFHIDENTAEVSLRKPLDDDFLSEQQEVMLFVTASDGKQESAALLVVTLPPVPTTTASTTTSTTCEPCPTYTTETITECPTETPCPSCPTTIAPIPSTTCEPCPTYTSEIITECSTETPCPSCPTTIATIPSTTCEPCPTYTSEAIAECPTETSCPPCPTTIATIPSTTSGSDRTTVTSSPGRPTLTFQKDSYTGDIYNQVDEVFRVQVNDVGHEVTYDWSENSEGKEYFNIHSISGTITVNKNNRPPEAIYELKAVATVKEAPSEKAEAKVNIHVLPLSQDQVFIINSLIRYTANENDGEKDIAFITLSQGGGKVCIKGIKPLSMKDHFEVESVGESKWKLRKTKELDYEEIQEITLVMEAFYSDINCADIVTDDIPQVLLRSQALAIISVKDKNDEKPVFNSGDAVVAYPTNEGLQRAVGPVITVQADDRDSTEVRYSLTGSDAAQFAVNDLSGEIFGVKSLNCESKCKFTVEASDGDNKAQLGVTVLPLEMDHVFTLVMNDTGVSDVDDALLQLSTETNVQISKLYVSPMQPIRTGRVRRHAKQEAQMSLEVHVYGIKEDSLMTLDVLNNALSEASSPLQAEEFIDVDVFEVEQNNEGDDDDTLGLTVAVAVLGSLLGLVIIAGIGFFIYQKRRGKAPKQPRPPSPISTLGNAYHNTAFEKDSESKGKGSLSHKTNGSLDGFTSVQIHKSQEGDSPPMHRSPLAIPSETIPLRTIENQQQSKPEGGLMRMNPTTSSEYYDSSNPTSPPSYTHHTTTTPESSLSSSSFPIYAEVKKPKNSKPKSTAFSSSSSSKPEIIPRSDYPNNFTEKKPAEPDTDYEEVGSSKFSGLKGSPPPRRSKKHQDSDDDNDEITMGSAYPGETNEKDEQAAPDEKKSVAFKVMVDTKEIEAENKGPAQRKAEAEKLMKENRKKLQEEDNTEDDEEEENEKL